MVDRLAALLGHFAVSARTFQSGPLCGVNTLSGTEPYGQLHLLRRGTAEVWHGASKAYSLDGPTLLFYPRPMAHRFVTDSEQGADFVCAHIVFEGGSANPLSSALPACVCIPLDQLPDSVPVLTLLFAEAEANNCGRQVMLDRLFEVLLVQLLRQLMENGSTQVGLLAGFAHIQLRRAIVAMHQAPERDWSVESLAAVAGMSRSVFANQFREAVGETPASYLQRWRVGLVQKWLKNGQPLRLIAEEAGYSSESALSRAFKSQCGLSPMAWLKQERLVG
ncbi:AraC family transcriptional regulator [Halopseudomonas salegens]|uniref:Transcriptional regulator, AraC family n=1 Tax=Halopseudomonas salegens TaxID=1434072 RepID=A0A1H2HDZ8_9GAMM|nr:AraC family transcriptional regulator [Halopseudomonas salegens]SDU30131.1 transcriptional regulator, AraC family [Halopseudomonas salegens]